MPKSQTSIENLDDSIPDKTERKSSSSSKRTSQRTRSASDKDLREKLTNCFDRIADALKERGDEELAEIIEDDAEVMASGLVSMTAPLKVLRTPLLVLVAIVEPLLAFGRIGRVLVARFAERRARAIAEREMMMDEAHANGGP